ncbi:multicopper oxidase family protein [Aestuariivirga sp.]|uniref:multicopper oxidase family protein n=1 Tax=Aestuariivirga sp. TaxID=2650926 RepID=UPI0039E270A3
MDHLPLPRLTRRALLCAAALPWARLALAADDPVTITAQRTDAQLLANDSPKSAIWSFAEGMTPRIIRATQGEELKLHFDNTLDFEMWLHWFGIRGPFDKMSFNVPAGGSGYDAVFTPPDAGTFWLGPLQDVSRLRDMGLYAMVIVAERDAPKELSDVPLVLDDWRLGDDGVISANFGDVETMVGEGRLGNWFTVNGRFRPHIALEPGKYSRLRILNAANVRTMGLLFKGGDPLLIALDGQPVKPAQLPEGAFKLAPGQRADLLVSPSQSMTLALDLFEDVAEIAYLDAVKEGPHVDLAENFALPANPISVKLDMAAARHAPLVIEGGIKGGLKSAEFKGQTLDLRGLLENGMGWAFNGMAGPGGPAVVAAKTGETIVLDVENRTTFEQPIHIHGHVWRLVREDGEAPWRDTAVIPAQSSLSLAFLADNPGTWAIQSLIAERADGGLLTGFTVG